MISTRDQINGPRTIHTGVIIQTGIEDIQEATIIKKRLVEIDNNFSYEITGVYGNYKIIKRELEPEESRYA